MKWQYQPYSYQYSYSIRDPLPEPSPDEVKTMSARLLDRLNHQMSMLMYPQLYSRKSWMGRVPVRFHVTKNLPEEYQQIRFPRSKKKRIRKKWRKDKQYWGMGPYRTYMMVGADLYVHPDTLQKIKRRFGIK